MIPTSMTACPACRVPFALGKGQAGLAGDHPSACPDRGGATEPSPDLTPMGAWRRCGEAKARIEAVLAARFPARSPGSAPSSGALGLDPRDRGWPPLRPPAVRPLNPEGESP